MASELSEELNRVELARELLRYKMQEYSQESYRASWVEGVEWELWTGKCPLDVPGVQRIRKECLLLAEIADGWWTWCDESPGNRRFVPVESWVERIGHPPESIDW